MRSQFVLRFAICVALLAITWIVFGQTLGHDFVNYDDPPYVTDNEAVRTGLSWDHVVWAFTHVHSNNWHPLTTMSHMLDCQLFGLKPGAHHFVNVLLHTIAVFLLFILLEQMTGNVWSSAFVAAIFAIHPLHVESVAWISERKDVLSAVFFMLTLLAYFYYTRKPSVGRYVAMSILFACGLLSKPMLVTLPIILLLIDYWPLKRFQKLSATRLAIEKIPLFILSAVSSVATIVAQSKGGLISLKVLPVTWRISNALSAYVIYIWQMLWPTDLALAYSHPDKVPIWQTATEATLLIAITICAFVARRRSPYLFAGWFWYLVMLLPVLGLIQVGGQAHADRYTYLPQIGLYVAATWGIVDLSKLLHYRAPILGAVSVIIITALAWRAADQVWYWHDSERLWRHSLAVTTENDVAHLGLGQLFSNQNRLNDAISEYEAAAKIGDPNPDVETALANLLLEQGRIDEAIRFYSHVARLQPSSALAHYNLAVGLHRGRHFSEAIVHYKAALAIDPNYPDADQFLGQALLENGQPEEANLHLKKN